MSERDKNGNSHSDDAKRPETPPPLPPAERDINEGYVPPNIPDTSTPAPQKEDDE